MCGLGAGNVFESLVSVGYHNTASANVQWRTTGHSYVTMPFFVKSTNQKILVGIDPTADQVESYGELFPPNFIFVVGEEDDFAYKITSRSKNRYFPEWVRIAKVIDQNTHRVLQTEGYEGDEFLRKAFANPQPLTLTYGTLPPLLQKR